MTALSDLIARLEKAQEGSRALDVQIELFLQPLSRQFDDGSAMIWHAAPGAAEKCSHLAPYYTTSLDAALTLVPSCTEEWSIGGGSNSGEASVWWGHDAEQEVHKGFGATPALALCIAALKAREAGR